MIKYIQNKWTGLFHFPLKAKEDGFYPLEKTQDGATACPQCGQSSYSRLEYCILECNYCHVVWRDLGDFGFRKVDL